MSAGTPPYAIFKEEFHQYYEPLCQYAFTFMKEPHLCEDIVQEIFLHIWEKRQDLIGTDNLRFYLYTAVRNNCLTNLQKNRKLAVTPLTGVEIADEQPDRFKVQRSETDFQQLLAAGLERLPPKCREVFVLSRMSKLTYQQIADTLGISIKTVENQMGKALKILRNYIREHPIHLMALVISFFSV